MTGWTSGRPPSATMGLVKNKPIIGAVQKQTRRGFRARAPLPTAAQAAVGKKGGWGGEGMGRRIGRPSIGRTTYASTDWLTDEFGRLTDDRMKG
ncbi:MAG: hypothetical protein GY847_12180 [Proteobacteria bacterium]|nr:hypothetical protein [Pseudomonadota bacterium]